MATYKRVQGNSLWIDYTLENVTDIDPVWTNWTGSWEIASTIGGTAIMSGTLIRTSTVGLFQFRIGPATGGVLWTSLPVGTYYLMTEINNTNVDFRDESADKLVITAQGI